MVQGRISALLLRSSILFLCWTPIFINAFSSISSRKSPPARTRYRYSSHSLEKQPQLPHKTRYPRHSSSSRSIRYASLEDGMVFHDDEEEDEEEALEWMSDREKAQRIRNATWKPAASNAILDHPSTSSAPNSSEEDRMDRIDDDNNNDDDARPITVQAETPSDTEGPRRKRLTYTSEEEELIEVLGGKDLDKPSPHRQDGYLGDSTLLEIAHDFQVPICYLADVLVGWGVPPPIDVNVWLGDMVTGEQAFAILEAIHTLDMGALNDRYAEMDLQTMCGEYGIEVRDGFELAMKEGWNLPFGIRTFLRVEQEDFLIETLAPKEYEYWNSNSRYNSSVCARVRRCWCSIHLVKKKRVHDVSRMCMF